MGLFDTVYVSGGVASAWQLRCRACGGVPDSTVEWQTKSLDPAMHSYCLRHDESGAIRLYLLGPPSDRRFWRPWTVEEIAASERMAEGGDLPAVFGRKRGEGRFLPEAYFPENRRQRFMGELPHQWVDVYARCACGEFLERWMKFCDGVVTEVCSEARGTEPWLFEDAGGWDVR